MPGLTKPGSICERTVDFMSIYPTLMDVCGLPRPAHLEGPSIKPLLADATAAWDQPAMTTYKFNNHAVRNEGWRHIRYANGDEELYNEATDPNEWANLAKDPQYNDTKAKLAAFMPKTNQQPVGGGEEKKEQKREKKKKMKEK